MSDKYSRASSLIPGGNIWFLLVFCLIGYATLNRGFAYLGSYPVFIGEFTLLFYLLILNHRHTLPRFLSTTAGKLWLFFFSYALIVFAFSALNDFNESIRNSVFWVYSIFFYIGYCYGNRLVQRQETDRFHDTLLFCAKLSVIYFSLFLFRENLRDMTMFLNGSTVALIGYYSTLHAISLGIIFFFLFYGHTRFYLIWILVGLVSIIAFSQARASMVAVAVIIVYLVFLYRKGDVLRDLAKLLMVVAIAISVFSIFDISIQGQRDEISTDFFYKAIESIIFGSDVETLEGSREDRLGMWASVIERTVAAPDSFMFGLGLDTILINRETIPGSVLRYPHNSFVSVFGLTGIVGFSAYVVLVGHILLRIIKSSRLTGSIPLLQWYPVFCIGYFVAAFFSTVFEAPFHSFVFWVITGIAYRMTNPRRFSPSFLPGNLSERYEGFK